MTEEEAEAFKEEVARIARSSKNSQTGVMASANLSGNGLLDKGTGENKKGLS